MLALGDRPTHNKTAAMTIRASQILMPTLKTAAGKGGHNLLLRGGFISQVYF